MHKTALLLACFVSLTVACAAEPGEPDAAAAAAAAAADVSAAPVQTLFAGASSSRTLAGDADEVYWTDGNAQTVMRAPRAGGDAKVLWRGHGMDSLGAIAVDRGVVYFNEDGRILSVPANGGEAHELVRLQRDFPIYLAADGDYVYWAGETDFAIGYTAYIRRVKKTGGRYETVYTGYYGVSTFAVRNDRVFFGGSDGTIVMNPPERLMKVPGSGGAPTQLLETPGVIRALTVDDDRAYFAIADHGWTVQSIGVDGGAANTLVTLPLAATNEVDDLAVTSDRLYWTSAGTFDFSKNDPDNHDAHVWSVPKTAGGAPELVADHIASPGSLAVSGECPVWTAKTTIELPLGCR